jgi:multimeric flavodoxin WrbA
MKITCILGSPRPNGSSAKIAESFSNAATAKQAVVKTYLLNRLAFRGCQGCMDCKTKHDFCTMRDVIFEILDEVKHSDLLVLASPVYYADVTSQLKAFIDRPYCYLTPEFKSRLTPGKKLVMILTQGDPDESHFTDIFPKYRQAFEWNGFKESHLIRACNTGEEKSGTVASAIKEASMLADRLCG